MSEDPNTEQTLVDSSRTGPVTLSTLQSDFASLGVKPGMVLLVHTSLSVSYTHLTLPTTSRV